VSKASKSRSAGVRHPHGPGRVATHRESLPTASWPHMRASRTEPITRSWANDIPLSRQLPCPVCAPHEHHLLPCEAHGCTCRDAPIPGLIR